jgi:poly-beta-1,6-N-acetyl-D-glucosamine synthase
MIYKAEIITGLIALAYLSWIFFLMRGWQRKLLLTEREVRDFIPVSVLIPFRNESSNLGKLCQDLLELHYDKRFFEIIFINDHSEDDGIDVIQRHLQDKIPYSIIELTEVQKGKKAALVEGISVSQYDWIVTTDADCRIPCRWLQLLALAQQEHPQVMWCGRVFYSGKKIWDQFLQHEFASVIGTGGATLQLAKPTMCNGANLAFNKKYFYDAGGYADSAHLASGDDEFLMHKMFKLSNGRVGFLNHPEHSVYTPGPSSIGDFVRQRVRWASKWQHYKNGFAKNFALLTFILQAVLLLLPLASIGGFIPWIYTGIVWCLKILADGLFINTILKDFERRINFFILLCLEVVYPFYVVSIGVLSRFSSYSWKGRKWK